MHAMQCIAIQYTLLNGMDYDTNTSSFSPKSMVTVYNTVVDDSESNLVSAIQILAQVSKAEAF